jgi:hypothetical protein
MSGVVGWEMLKIVGDIIIFRWKIGLVQESPYLCGVFQWKITKYK